MHKFSTSILASHNNGGNGSEVVGSRLTKYLYKLPNKKEVEKFSF